jgi:5-methylthioadenosine/S-adenosylhomocysteine deaminase
MELDIAIVNTNLITFEGNNLGIIDNCGLGITRDKISFIGSMNDFQYQSANIVIDGSDKVTMPGLVNAHFHSGFTLLRGVAQDVPEIEWMNRAIGPFAQHISEDDRILGSKLGVLEGIRYGTTTFAEYTSHVSSLIENVYQPWSVRVVATETINEISSNRAHLKPTDLYEFDRTKGEDGLQRANSLHQKYKENSLISCMYGPQALDMISLDLLKTVRENAKEEQSAVHMHVAQGGREQLQIQGRYGTDATTIKVLNEHDLLSNNLIAGHIHGTTAAEREIMVKKEVKLASCQSSIAMIDGIIPPLNHYLSLGGTAGLGTDQAPGPGNHNMIREMRSASVFAKIQHQDPTILPAWQVLQLGTVGGAQVLGLEDQIGSLKVGKQADVITIDLKQLNLTPRFSKPFHNIIPNLIYSASGSEVDNVIIQGTFLLQDGKFVDIDTDSVMKESNDRITKIVEEASNDWQLADSLLVQKVKEGWL